MKTIAIIGFVDEHLYLAELIKTKQDALLEHPVHGKIGSDEIIQPAFYDKVSVPPV